MCIGSTPCSDLTNMQVQENGLVSIITPCYNAGQYIKFTIASVQKQTYTHWEMLVVDDCSTDNSAEIVKQMAQEDLRIRYLKTEKPSGSPTMPRNIALDNARGQYIAFLDADDLWMPEKLEEQLAFMAAREASFVYSDYEKMDAAGRRKARVVRVRETTRYWDMLETDSVPFLTAVVKSETIGDIRFRDTAKEDYVFWLELLRKREIMGYNTGKVHACYREAHGSRSGDKLDMIRKQWFVLRQVEGAKWFPAVYFMFIYLIKGIAKYIK